MPVTIETVRPAQIVITGRDAQSIKTHVRIYIKPQSGLGWREVQGMNECKHGCKLHVRRRGCVDEYALIHYSGYGCTLGRDSNARMVAVSVRPAVLA